MSSNQKYVPEVRYLNQVNNITLTGLDTKEMDALMLLLQRSRVTDGAEITMTKKEFADAIHYNTNNSQQLLDAITTIQLRMLRNFTLIYEDEKERSVFNLLSYFKISKKEDLIKIKVSDDLNKFLKNFGQSRFTEFYLLQFLSLKSVYSKKLFPYLAQFKSTGKYTVLLTDFKKYMDVPKNYRMGNIDQRILKPVVKELSEYFKKLKYIKNKRKGHGNAIYSLTFTFASQPSLESQRESIKAIEIIPLEDLDIRAQEIGSKTDYNNLVKSYDAYIALATDRFSRDKLKFDKSKVIKLNSKKFR